MDRILIVPINAIQASSNFVGLQIIFHEAVFHRVKPFEFFFGALVMRNFFILVLSVLVWTKQGNNWFYEARIF